MPRGRVAAEPGEAKPRAKKGPKDGKAPRIGRPSPKVAASAPPPPVGSEQEGIQEVTSSALATMRSLEKSIRERIAKGELTAAVQREASSLARSIVALGAEQRQQEKFWAERAAKLDDQTIAKLVIEWLAETSPARRDQVAAAIAEMQGENTLLG